MTEGFRSPIIQDILSLSEFIIKSKMIPSLTDRKIISTCTCAWDVHGYLQIKDIKILTPIMQENVLAKVPYLLQALNFFIHLYRGQ